MEALGSGGPTEDDVREALQKLDPLWDELFPAEKERIVKLLVEEVVVSKDGLLIRLRLHGLNSLVAELQAEGPAGAVGPVGSDGPVEPGKDGQTLDIRVPMEFKTRGGRKEIILPADAAVQPKAQPMAAAFRACGALAVSRSEIVSCPGSHSRNCFWSSRFRRRDTQWVCPDESDRKRPEREKNGLSRRFRPGRVPTRTV